MPAPPPAPDLVLVSDLQARARAAWERSGLTQAELAAAIGVTQAAVSIALGDPSQSLTRVRVAVIERCAGRPVSGPYYVVG